MAGESVQNGKKSNYPSFITEYRFAVKLGEAEYGSSNKRSSRVCFSKISGISSSLDYDEISEGGYNDSPHLVAVPHKKHAPLVLEKGVAPKDSWMSQVKPGMMLGTWLEVVMLDGSGKETDRRFLIYDGLITKWEISGLNALGNSILIEKLEIMHEGIHYS